MRPVVPRRGLFGRLGAAWIGAMEWRIAWRENQLLLEGDDTYGTSGFEDLPARQSLSALKSNDMASLFGFDRHSWKSSRPRHRGFGECQQPRMTFPQHRLG